MKLYCFYTLKALWDGQGKIKMYYGMARAKKQLLRKRSIAVSFLTDILTPSHVRLSFVIWYCAFCWYQIQNPVALNHLLVVVLSMSFLLNNTIKKFPVFLGLLMVTNAAASINLTSTLGGYRLSFTISLKHCRKSDLAEHFLNFPCSDKKTG